MLVGLLGLTFSCEVTKRDSSPVKAAFSTVTPAHVEGATTGSKQESAHGWISQQLLATHPEHLSFGTSGAFSLCSCMYGLQAMLYTYVHTYIQYSTVQYSTVCMLLHV